ncbi:MAG: phage portal protein, partial [Enterobacterales bacterium]
MFFFRKRNKPQAEERSGFPWPGWPQASNLAVFPLSINPLAAENLSVVMACVAVISTAVAGLPTYIYRLAGKTRLEAPEHALAGLIVRGPNHAQTWPDMIEFVMAQVLLFGNALVEVVADAQGRVIELKPIPWPNVS